MWDCGKIVWNYVEYGEKYVGLCGNLKEMWFFVAFNTSIFELSKLYIRDIKITPCFQSIGDIAQAYQNILKVEIAYTIKISLPLEINTLFLSDQNSLSCLTIPFPQKVQLF